MKTETLSFEEKKVNDFQSMTQKEMESTNGGAGGYFVWDRKERVYYYVMRK